MFQSAPRAYTRGDIPRWNIVGYEVAVSIRAPGLHPRRRPRRCARAIRYRFNPRPGLTPEATEAQTPSSTPHAVSIRAPGLHPRRLRANVPDSERNPFQSAPRAYTRGDSPAQRSRFWREWFQSAPRAYTRGDYTPWNHSDVVDVSIRAPGLHPRRRLLASSSPPHTCFNPRPGLTPEATNKLVALGFRPWLFQSAPRAYTRGDPAR